MISDFYLYSFHIQLNSQLNSEAFTHNPARPHHVIASSSAIHYNIEAFIGYKLRHSLYGSL